MVAETQDEQDFYGVYHDILPKVFPIEELTSLDDLIVHEGKCKGGRKMNYR